MPMNSGKDYKARVTDVAQPLNTVGLTPSQGGDVIVAPLTANPYADNEAQESKLVIAIQERAVAENPGSGPDGKGCRDDGQAYTLEGRSTVQAVAFNLRGREGGAVRRLTPRECERLQGFPDNYTMIPDWRREWYPLTDYIPMALSPHNTWEMSWIDALALASMPDSPRYKGLGNSMAVPVMRWIGERIQQVEAL